MSYASAQTYSSAPVTYTSAHDGLTYSFDPMTHAVTLVEKPAKIEEPVAETDELPDEVKTKKVTKTKTKGCC